MREEEPLLAGDSLSTATGVSTSTLDMVQDSLSMLHSVYPRLVELLPLMDQFGQYYTTGESAVPSRPCFLVPAVRAASSLLQTAFRA